MCFASNSPTSGSRQDSCGWKLEKKGQAWQLKVEAADVPNVDVSPCGSQLEIQLLPGARPMLVKVPTDAQPLEMASTKCTFSRRRSELLVEWCQDAIRSLERVQCSVSEVESAVPALLSAVSSGSVPFGKARDDLAQLEARIEKLQCKGVDSVEISEDAEDRQAAKALRKELTRRLETLQLQVEECFKRLNASSSKDVEVAGTAEPEAEAEEDERSSDSSGVIVEELKLKPTSEADEDDERSSDSGVIIEEVIAIAEDAVQADDGTKSDAADDDTRPEADWEVLPEVDTESSRASLEALASPETEPIKAMEAVEETREAAATAAKTEEVVEEEEEEEAVEVEVVQETPSRTAEEWKTLGNDAVKAGDHAAALEHYSAGLRVEPDHAILLSNRALCLHKMQRLEEAIVDSKRCMVLRPEFHKGFLRAAMVLKELGRCQEAFEVLRRSPSHAEIEKFAEELRPLAEAEEERRIGSLCGAEKRKEEANALFKKGQVEQALAAYKDALKMCDSEISEVALAIRNNMANCYSQLSNFEGVVQESSFVLEHQPDNLKALIRRMIALEPLEKYERALEDARRILRQVPGHEVANRMQHRLGKLVRDRQREREQGL